MLLDREVLLSAKQLADNVIHLCGSSTGEKHSEPTPQVRGREADEHRSRKKGPAGRSATTPTDRRPHTNATFEAEIVSPTSVSTATSDAATIEQTGQPGCTPMIKLDRRRPYHHTVCIAYNETGYNRICL